MQLPSFAQGDAFAYTPPATLGSLREAQSVMEYFTAGTTVPFNQPGFVQFTRQRTLTLGGPDHLVVTVTKLDGTLANTKMINFSNAGLKTIFPVACAYNKVSKQYCVVGNGVVSPGGNDTLQAWYMVFDQNMTIISKQRFRMNFTSPFNSKVTVMADVCEVNARGVAPNIVNLEGFAMTGVVADGNNISPTGANPSLRQIFIAKIDATNGLVNAVNGSGSGARAFNASEAVWSGLLQSPNRLCFPSKIIQLTMGTSQNGGYYIIGTGPRVASNLTGSSSTALPIVNGAGSIMHIRRGYNLSLQTGQGGSRTGSLQVPTINNKASGSCAIWDSTNNEIRIVGNFNNTAIVIDKLTGVNALGHPINVFSATVAPASIPCLAIPCGSNKTGKMYQAQASNAVYGVGSAKNTAITGVSTEGTISCFNNQDAPYITIFDYAKMGTGQYTPATWPTQTFFNNNELIYYPRAVQSSLQMNYGNYFGNLDMGYPNHNSAQIPFNTNGFDEQFGMGGYDDMGGVVSRNIVNQTDNFNGSCNLQPDVFTPYVIAQTKDSIAPPSIIGISPTFTNTTISDPFVTTTRSLQKCSISFFKQDPNNTGIASTEVDELLVTQQVSTLLLKAGKNIASINIYTITGALVLSTPVDKSFNLNTSQLPTGLYIIEALNSNKQKITSKKITIN
jgi:hypothetical protein